MNNPKKIFVHCTATSEGVPYTVDDIDRWHKANGWCCIGYHKVVLLDGSVELGRDPDNDKNVEEHIGAHAYGYNKDSLAVVYVGGTAADGTTPKDTRTAEQKKALLAIVADWCKRFNISVNNVHGHYEVANKACPSFNMDTFREELKRYLQVSVPCINFRDLPTTSSIETLQQVLNVKVDGWLGPETYTALFNRVCKNG